MNTIYVFHNGQLIHQTTGKLGKFSVPQGAYVYESKEGNCYLKLKVALVPLNKCDFPKELRVLCLVLGIH